MSKEFEIIEQVFRRRAGAVAGSNVLLGIGDDAALTRLSADADLVTATDALVAGTHFLPAAPAASVGHRCLAVNLSDMAAMAAEPLWASLALGLPEVDSSWLNDFAEGFFSLADRYAVVLIGGDTVRSNLFASVTVQGSVPHGQAVRRSGAAPGDYIFVTGHPGDAVAGRLLASHELNAGVVDVQSSANGSDRVAADAVADESADESCKASVMPSGNPSAAALTERFYYPEPRVQAGLALRGLATSMIDVSDGLHTDLSKLLAASGLGAVLDIAELPLSASLQALVEYSRAVELALCGGDDYELCFTVAAGQVAQLHKLAGGWGFALTCLGRVGAGPGLRWILDGAAYTVPASGFEHFT